MTAYKYRLHAFVPAAQAAAASAVIPSFTISIGDGAFMGMSTIATAEMLDDFNAAHIPDVEWVIFETALHGPSFIEWLSSKGKAPDND